LLILLQTLTSYDRKIADTLKALGESWGNRGDFSSALELFEDALDIFKRLKYKPDDPKLIMLEKEKDLASRLLTKAKGKWEILR
jgi:hypothetical protein